MKIAVIDVGSNAIRMLIAEASGGKFETVANFRESLRLGHDVFLRGRISEETIGRAVRAFVHFADLQRQHNVELNRAIATSATREAANREALIERIRRESGIELDCISGVEEGRLIYQAVLSRLDLAGSNTLIAELGGGSMELILVEGGRLSRIETYKIGAVRLLETLAGEGREDVSFPVLVREYIDGLRGHMQKATDRFKADRFVATGGNVEKIAALLRPQATPEAAGDHLPEITREELRELVLRLSSLSYSERIEKLGLDPDRADVILPAAIVIFGVMEATGMERLVAPLVGLKEGVAKELASNIEREPARAQLHDAALLLGRRYQFDEGHAVRVARNALFLFERLAAIHRLDTKHSPLIDCAAVLHDVGFFINGRRHHKHSHYLILNSNIPGLTVRERRVVANIARYHRKAAPRSTHPNLQRFDRADRDAVRKLSAIVRIADALDRDHAGAVEPASVAVDGATVTIRVRVHGDLALGKWAIGRKSGLFQDVFGYKVKVEES